MAVGAIIMVGDHVLVPCDIRSWRSGHDKWFGDKIHNVSRIQPIIERTLKEPKELRKPPILRKDRDGKTRGDRIPAVRFPQWMRCPKCGLLYKNPWGRDIKVADKPRCLISACRAVLLAPVPWIMISGKGYMSDLPWWWLAHREAARSPRIEQKNCKDSTNLHILYFNGPESDHRLVLRCKTCGAEEDLGGLFNQQFLSNIHEMSSQPWDPTIVVLSDPQNDPDDSSQASIHPIAVKLSDTRIHLPEIVSTLTIPPESRVDPKDLRARLLQHRDFGKIEAWQNQPAALNRILRDMARELNSNPEALRGALQDIESGYRDRIHGQAYAQTDDAVNAEYQALTTEYQDMREWETFITRHVTKEWHDLLEDHAHSPLAVGLGAAVDQLVIAERLREIQAFLGFRRVSHNGTLIYPDITGEVPWIPACELFGEGFFLKLNENMLGSWENIPQVQNRSALLKNRMENSTVPCQAEPTPRFLLLHTLAHLIIRELESVCGYPAASLKERLYCREPVDNHAAAMAGILIYVAVPDKAGSLGGLTIQGEPANFLRMMLRALNKAQWCSLDPICSEQEGQGPDQLNLAACHTCCLLPETSCQYSNVLLDRLVLSGRPQNALPGFIDILESIGQKMRQNAGCR